MKTFVISLMASAVLVMGGVALPVTQAALAAPVASSVRPADTAIALAPPECEEGPACGAAGARP